MPSWNEAHQSWEIKTSLCTGQEGCAQRLLRSLPQPGERFDIVLFLPGLQLSHRSCENPDLVLGGHPGLMVILKRQHFCSLPPQPPSSLMGTAGLGSPSAVSGRKYSSMCGMWSWHLLARVSRCQERRGQKVPSCTA